MSYRLYVGNLPYTTDDNALAALFRPFGPVISGHVVRDRESGKSRGFGFIEMREEADLAQANEALNGQPYEGHLLNLLEARDRDEDRRSHARQAGEEPGRTPTARVSLARRLGQRTRR